MKPTNQLASILFIVLISLVSFPIFAAKNDCKLTLGYDSWEPYQYLDVGNQVRGLDIEILLMVAERMPCKIEYAQGSWVDLLSRMRKGEIDVLLGASKTSKREQFALFSVPYRTEQFALYVREDDKASRRLTSFNEFIAQDKKLGVVGDYFYGNKLSDLRDKDEDKHFVDAIISEMNIARLLDENIDAFLEDSIVGASMIRRKGLSSLIVPHGLSITTGDVYVMFSRKSVSPVTLANFNRHLKKVVESDDFEALIKLYKH